MEYHIFIDESRYLEHDKFKYMVIGGIWIPIDSIGEVKSRIKETKKKYNLFGEIKWTHLSPSSILFYREIINYFFDNSELSFRCVTVNKENLSFEEDFYYKVCYQLLIKKIQNWLSYRVFLDYKDKYNKDKISTLKRCLTSSLSDIEEEIVNDINTVKSENSIFIQLCDLLIGAVGYERNKLNTSNAKLEIVKLILKRANRRNFNYSSSLKEDKFNIFNMFDSKCKNSQ